MQNRHIDAVHYRMKPGKTDSPIPQHVDNKLETELQSQCNDTAEINVNAAALSHVTISKFKDTSYV